MEGMQGLSNKFELKKENNSSYIKKDSDKTLQTIQTMQNDGICRCTEMVEAARDEGNYSIEEILNWIKSYEKDITKTEIERSLEKLRVTHEVKDQAHSPKPVITSGCKLVASIDLATFSIVQLEGWSSG